MVISILCGIFLRRESGKNIYIMKFTQSESLFEYQKIFTGTKLGIRPTYIQSNWSLETTAKKLKKITKENVIFSLETEVDPKSLSW